MGKLTDAKVKNAGPGKYGDGDGLQLVVSAPTRASPKGARKWVLRFMQDGKAREMGLGSYPEIGLAEARDRAYEQRKIARSGLDPIAERAKEPEKATAIPTFGELADEIAGQLADGFRN